MIQETRIKALNDKIIQEGGYVIYWMQASQRTEYNHALEFAILRANRLNLPIVCFFGITETYPDANERHYFFMLEGLKNVVESLEERGIQTIIWRMSPHLAIEKLAKKASLIIVDKGYLKLQREWRNYVAFKSKCPLLEVESDVIVPIEIASSKEEYSARTIRSKIKRILKQYLIPLEELMPKVDSITPSFDSYQIDDIQKALNSLRIDRSVKKVTSFHGGTNEAKKMLDVFLKNKIHEYAQIRNDPSKDCLSNMSPFLHFGQISPLYIALKVLETDSPGKEAYLEELIIRRELSMNYVFYNKDYDSFDGLPFWAKKTLFEHKKDPRNYIYSVEELEQAETHDSYWNAAQEEMRKNGKMHGYMRMYWGKKIIEWTKSPEEAFQIALHLNNKYELDGRDPNGFTGIAWCFGKHDRPWKERDVFGKIRYMGSIGLERKFDIEEYVRKIKLI